VTSITNNVPDTSGIWPISHSCGVDHQMTSGLLEEEVILKQEIFSY